MKQLIGLEIISAKINEENDLVKLETNKGNFYLRWIGDCCANCFLQHVNGIDFLLGSVIVDIRDNEWKVIENEYDETLESMGTTIITNKGFVDFESRVSHNGYYSGWIEIEKNFKYEHNFVFRDLKDF